MMQIRNHSRRLKDRLLAIYVISIFLRILPIELEIPNSCLMHGLKWERSRNEVNFRKGQSRSSAHKKLHAIKLFGSRAIRSSPSRRSYGVIPRSSVRHQIRHSYDTNTSLSSVHGLLCLRRIQTEYGRYLDRQ